MKIGIIAANEVELEDLKEKMLIEEIMTISKMKIYIGSVGNNKCVLALSGMGKVNATMCAQTIILKYGVDFILNIGVAGGIDSNLKQGDIFIADAVVQHDYDTSAITGDVRGLLPNVGKVKIETSALLKKKFIDLMDCENRVHTEFGTIVSGDQFIASADKATELRNEFGAKACDMESAAIGQVCVLNGVEFLIIRAISDSAGDSADTEYQNALEFASKEGCNIIYKLISNLDV